MRKVKTQNMLDEFLLEMEISNKARNTIVNYRSDLKNFLEKYPSGIENITVDLLREHLGGLGEKSPTTRARHMSSLKKFLDWCYKKDFISDNPISKIEREKQTNGGISPKIEKTEIQAIISSINENKLKYKLIFTLMLEAGLKANEALNLEYDDIEPGTKTIFIRSGYARRVPLFTTESIRLFKIYAAKMKIKSGFIFNAGEMPDKTLSYQALNKFWRKCCSKIGSNIKLHQLRDCYAKELVEKGIDMFIISQILGHRKLQTTSKYILKQSEPEVPGK